MVTFICAHCATQNVILHPTILTSGTVLTCLKCERETVFDIWTIEQRRETFVKAGMLN